MNMGRVERNGMGTTPTHYDQKGREEGETEITGHKDKGSTETGGLEGKNSTKNGRRQKCIIKKKNKNTTFGRTEAQTKMINSNNKMK